MTNDRKEHDDYEEIIKLEEKFTTEYIEKIKKLEKIELDDLLSEATLAHIKAIRDKKEDETLNLLNEKKKELEKPFKEKITDCKDVVRYLALLIKQKKLL